MFTIAPSRSLKVLTTQLGVEHDPDTGALPDVLPGGRRLLLSSDFYTVYQSVGRLDGVDNLWYGSEYAEAGIMRNGAVRVARVACGGGDRRDAWSGRFCILTGFRGTQVSRLRGGSWAAQGVVIV